MTVLSPVNIDSVADFVAPGRCLHCGHKLITWPPQVIVEAARKWAVQHGRPPGANDWQTATPDYPACITVRNVFGTWNRMIEAAGYTPRPAHGPSIRTKEKSIDALLDWLLLHGRWPTTKEWNRSEDGHPHAGIVRDLFGKWSVALKEAGRTAKLRGRIWVEPAPPYQRPECAECGTDLENTTLGCGTCSSRAHTRRKRERTAA